MDRVHYAGDTFLTGSEIAHALLDYAQALSQAGTSGTVHIPTVDASGVGGTSELLVGPASQLISHREETPFLEVSDPALVGRLTVEAERLRRYGVASPTAEVDGSDTTPDPWPDEI